MKARRTFACPGCGAPVDVPPDGAIREGATGADETRCGACGLITVIGPPVDPGDPRRQHQQDRRRQKPE